MAGGGKVGVAAAALSTSLALVVSGCGGKPTTTGASSSANPPGATTVKLAFVGPLSGADANSGIEIRNGAKMAVQEAEGAGVKVDLVEFDTHGGDGVFVGRGIPVEAADIDPKSQISCQPSCGSRPGAPISSSTGATTARPAGW